jgi:predicted DNA-binding transcriptional regulator AlpA
MHTQSSAKQNTGQTTQRPAQSPYLDTNSAAVFLGMGRRNLERLRATGGGPRFVKIGRKCAYRTEALEAWVTAREFASTSEARRAGYR